ncbi:family 16 glycosylhydrolase [Capillibacterium thermochitinicola]|uniref:Family 16 glycosylhydrolase n=1 Tax=Capillibacterium thermochitinicola TaxID=2699427 RepID=A0A8J6HYD7_9FIRM|nr:family 16 glycosylhydrolase [Capillibacterium thermochitinicola]MBA2133827.1 family 16 glycosylhydrolase [Capillibacterium thermochitinicola]
MTLSVVLQPKNQVANGDFSKNFLSSTTDGASVWDTNGTWQLALNVAEAAGNAYAENGIGVVAVTAGAGGEGWNVQLLYAPVAVEKGATYRVSFDARSETAGSQIAFIVGGGEDVGWRKYFNASFNLTTEMKNYTEDFIVEVDSNDNARVEIWLINNDTYYFDNVKLIKIAETDFASLPQPGTLTEADEDKVEDWQLVWSDEFDGPEIERSIWNFEVGNGHDKGIPGWGNNELQYYTDGENVSIEDGKLVIEAREEVRTDQYGTYQYTSTRMTTEGKFEIKYGRVEIRARLPIGKGIWPAFWMLGNDIGTVGWPKCGEIDIMEYLGHQPDTVYGTVHGPVSREMGVSSGYRLETGNFHEEFHVFAMEWDPDEIEFYVDDQLYHVVNKYEIGLSDWVFDHPHFFIINLAVGGNWPGYPDETTVFPQRMEIDYIRVYEDVNPDSIDGLEEWDCDYERWWKTEPEVDRVTGDKDPEYYFMADDPTLIDVIYGWDPNSKDGDITLDTWGTWAPYKIDAFYAGKNCWEVTAAGGWSPEVMGSALALMGDVYSTGAPPADFPADLSTYDYIKLEVAVSEGSTFNDIKIKLALPQGKGHLEPEISLKDYGFDPAVQGEWQSISIPLSAFESTTGEYDLSEVTQIGLFSTFGQVGVDKYYVTDYYLLKI